MNPNCNPDLTEEDETDPVMTLIELLSLAPASVEAASPCCWEPFISHRTLARCFDLVADLDHGIAVYTNKNRDLAVIGARGLRQPDQTPGIKLLAKMLLRGNGEVLEWPGRYASMAELEAMFPSIRPFLVQMLKEQE